MQIVFDGLTAGVVGEVTTLTAPIEGLPGQFSLTSIVVTFAANTSEFFNPNFRYKVTFQCET